MIKWGTRLMDDTESLFNQLQECLKAQEEIVDRLIAAGETQFEALRKNNLGELNKATREMEACSAAMERAEQQRLLVQHSLEEALKVAKGMTLSKLLPFAGESIRDPLQQQYFAMKEKVTNLSEINMFNTILINKAQMVNGSLFKFFYAGSSTSYGVKGVIENKLNPISLLNRSI